jgi:hypothetical protein
MGKQQSYINIYKGIRKQVPKPTQRIDTSSNKKERKSIKEKNKQYKGRNRQEDIDVT